MPSDTDLARTLDELFDAERAARRAHAELAEADTKQLLPLLERAVRQSVDHDDEDEASLRLVRLAHVLGEMHGPQVVDLLVDVLACDLPEARHAAGEALEDLAYDRFKEVALGVERALERLPKGSIALAELPYMLADIPEPGVAKLLARFLAHDDAEAVAAAIEALVEMGDPTAATLLTPLEKDMRRVQLEDDEGEESSVTIAELVAEARKLLGPAEAAAPKGRSS
jgi:HEAT repeat protein